MLGFTLVDVLVSMGLFAMGFTSLYTGISSGVQVIQTARENLRATQIITEKMETARLYAWEQVVSGTNVPPAFIDHYYPPAVAGGQGITYYGSVTITNAPFETHYDEDMRVIIVSLTWTNGQIPHTRRMQTLVARNGMQNYIF